MKNSVRIALMLLCLVVLIVCDFFITYSLLSLVAWAFGIDITMKLCFGIWLITVLFKMCFVRKEDNK